MLNDLTKERSRLRVWGVARGRVEFADEALGGFQLPVVTCARQRIDERQAGRRGCHVDVQVEAAGIQGALDGGRAV